MRLLILMAAVPLAACGGTISTGMSGTTIPASGSGGERSFAVADFTEVALRGSDNVEIQVGPAFAVTATGPAEALDRLEIVRDGNVLKIGRKSEMGFNWGGSRNEGVRVRITMPRITGANIAGSGDMTIDRIAGDFDGSIAGSGNLRLASLQGGKADFAIAGSGDLFAAGRVDALDVSVAGSGNVRATELIASAADVSIAGSGDVRARVNGRASVSIVGSGDVDLGPDARCSTSRMGSGNVSCGS